MGICTKPHFVLGPDPSLLQLHFPYTLLVTLFILVIVGIGLYSYYRGSKEDLFVFIGTAVVVFAVLGFIAANFSEIIPFHKRCPEPPEITIPMLEQSVQEGRPIVRDSTHRRTYMIRIAPAYNGTFRERTIRCIGNCSSVSIVNASYLENTRDEPVRAYVQICKDESLLFMTEIPEQNISQC